MVSEARINVRLGVQLNCHLASAAMLSKPGLRGGTLDRDTGGLSTSMNFFAALLWLPNALLSPRMANPLHSIFCTASHRAV